MRQLAVICVFSSNESNDSQEGELGAGMACGSCPTGSAACESMRVVISILCARARRMFSDVRDALIAEQYVPLTPHASHLHVHKSM